MKSKIQTEKECYICRKLFDICNDRGLHEHHVFEGWGNRRCSEAWGMKIWCCPMHHNMSQYGIHFNKDLDMDVKRDAQRIFEKEHSREEFMQIFGRNYLDD